MKKIFQYFMVAAAAIALSSCTNVKEGSKVKENTTHINVIAQANPLADEGVETKTYLGTNPDDNTPNTVIWGTDEYMKLAVSYTSGSTEQTVFATSSEANADGLAQATFAFNFSYGDNTPDEESTYTYMGIYPASAAVANNNEKAENYKVDLPATQNATATSYDPAAYIMVAKPQTFNEAQTEWMASYRRATALNKVTLKNLPAAVQEAGIKKVELSVTANEGNTYLAGRRYIDLRTGESGNIYSGGGRTNTVAVKFDKYPSGNANADVWFTSWGVELKEGDAVTVAVHAGGKIYLRIITLGSGRSISFKEGYLNTLGVNMGGADVIVSDDTEFPEGQYVVVSVDGSNPQYALQAQKESGKQRLRAVGYSNSLESYSGDADIIWNITKSGDSYIFENNGQYLGYKGSSNESYWLEPGEEWTETNYLLDITAQDTEGQYYVTVNSNPSRYLSRNSSFFAFYGNTNQMADLVFVPATVDNRAPAYIGFVNAMLYFTPADYASFSGQDVSVDPAVDEIVDNIVWSFENPSGVIDESQSDGENIVLTGNEGYAIVWASFAGNENYRPAQGSYRIDVSGTLTFPFTSAISGWPASNAASAAGEYTYRLNGTNYTFTHTKEGKGIYCQSSYLMLSQGNYLGLPAIKGQKLVTVIAQLNPGGSPSTSSKGKITSDTNGTVVTGGEEQTFKVKGEYYSFDLTGTEANTVYYLSIGNANFQCTEISLIYEPAAERLDSEMSWNMTSATAEITNDGAYFTTPTAPALSLGYASAVTYNSTNPDVATIGSEGEITIVGGGETTLQAIFAGDDTYKPKTAELTLTVTDSRTLTVADIIARGAGSYEIENVVVMATRSGDKNFVVADATGAIVVYHSSSSHGFEIGDVVTVSGSVTEYSGILEFSQPTVTKTGTTTPSYPEAAEFDADKITAYATASTVEYAHAKGVVNGYDLTVADGKVLNVYGDMSAAEGRTADIYGYSIGYASGKVRFMLVGTAAIDETVPYISVTPGAYAWGAGETDFKKFAVKLNENNIGFSTEVLSGNSADWTYNGSSSILFIKPKAANTSTTEDKVIVIRIKHSGVYQDVTCTQYKVSDGIPTLQYTLDGTITATGNAYASASTVTQNDIEWKVTANTEMNPWRVGGKSLTNVDRPIYSTTAIPANISQITVGTGTGSNNVTVNSLTISVHNSAADAASGSNAIATKTFTTGIAGATVTFDKEDNTSWAGKFYRIVYNVTRTQNSNGYITFYSAEFYGTN